MDKKLEEIIDAQNMIKAQNVALTFALSSLLDELPAELRASTKKRYDLTIAIFQNCTNDGKTDLQTLQIQREQFETAGKRIFHT